MSTLSKDRRTELVNDCIAAAVMIIAAVYTFMIVPEGINSADEAFYFTIPHRLFLGDRLFADEWHVSQLSGVLQYPLVWAFMRMTGGTEGIILYLRYCYAVLRTGFGAWLYAKLRRFGKWGAVSVFIFLIYEAFGYLTVNYYNLDKLAAAAFLIIVFYGKKDSAVSSVMAGILFAVNVLASPFTAFGYFGFTAFLLICAAVKKERLSVFSVRGSVYFRWKWMTAGIMASALLFSVFFIGPSLPDILRTLPELFTDAEYDFLAGGENFLRLYKVSLFFTCVGKTTIVLNCCWLATFLATLKHRKGSRIFLFIYACVIFCVSYIYVFYISEETRMQMLYFAFNFPLTVFGISCFLLTENKNRKLAGFLSAGIVLSLLSDIASDVSLGFLLVVPNIAVPFAVKELTDELRTEKRQTKRFVGKLGRKTSVEMLVTGTAVLLAAVIMTGSVLTFMNIREDHTLVEYYYLEGEYQGDALIEKGPLKGLKTNADVLCMYEDAMADLDVIKEKNDGYVYITSLCPWYYLYLSMPYSTPAAYYTEKNDIRQISWWKLHPDRVPETVYVPFFDCDTYTRDDQHILNELDFIGKYFEYEKTEGKAGYILEIKGIRPESIII